MSLIFMHLSPAFKCKSTFYAQSNLSRFYPMALYTVSHRDRNMFSLAHSIALRWSAWQPLIGAPQQQQKGPQAR